MGSMVTRGAIGPVGGIHSFMECMVLRERFSVMDTFLLGVIGRSKISSISEGYRHIL